MAYDKPKVDLINKKYETLTKGLEKMYGDVTKNQAAIRKRNINQQKAEITKLRRYQDRFIKGTQKDFIDAKDILGNIDNKDFKTQFQNDLNGQFKGGLESIKNYIENNPTASDGDIQLFVTDMIGKAQGMTNGIIGANAYAVQRDEAFQKNAQSPDGTGNGSLVVDDNYPGILGALASNDDLDFGNLRIAGSIENGVSIFSDAQNLDDGTGTGNLIGDGKYDASEVLDLTKVGADFKSGAIPPFSTVKAYSEYKKTISKSITAQKTNPDFYKELTIEDSNGQQTKKLYVDTKARNDYFLNGDGKSLIDGVFNTPDNKNAMIQKFGGMTLLQEYTEADPNTQEGRDQMQAIELMAKTAFIESIGLDLKPDQDKALNSSNFSTGSTYTTSNPGHDAIYEVAKENHKKTKDIIYGSHTGANSLNIGLAGMKTNFMGKYIKATGGNRDTGHGMITDIKVGATSDEYLVTMTVNNPTDPTKTKQVEVSYDFSKKEEKEFFERDILNGSFPSARADGTLLAMVGSADRNEPKYKGKTTTRVNNRSGGGGNTVSTSVGQATIQDAQDAISAEDLLIQYEQDYRNNTTNTNTGNNNTGNNNNNNNTNTGNNNNNNNNNNQQNQPTSTYQSLVTPSGITVPVNSTGYIEDKRDGSTESSIAKVLNFEKKGNYTNMGFTGGGGTTKGLANKAAFEKVKAEVIADNGGPGGLDDKYVTALAAEQTVSQYIIGDGSNVTLEGGNTLITTDLGINRDEFNALESNVKDYLIDYKMNSGRGAKEMLMVANGVWDGVIANKNVSALENGKLVYPEGHTKAGDEIPDGEKSKWTTVEETEQFNNFDVNANSKPSDRQLELSRRKLYMIDGRQGFAADQGARMDISKIKKQKLKVPKDAVKSYKQFNRQFNKKSKSEQRSFYLSQNLIPGDELVFDDGKVFKIPNY